MKTKYILLSILVLASFASCKKWLDVKPKIQVESAVNFEDAQGFKDALTGVYLNMVSPNLYGKELSFGFIEVLGKNYTQFTTGQGYVQDAAYNYAFAATKARIDNIWKGNYNTIANINNLIENLEKVDKSMFSDTEYDVIKGEAYGLRAFNHFDLLRLYAPSPAAGGSKLPGIPYRDKFENNTVPQSTVEEVIARIITDLETAAALLKTSDPIVAGTTVPTTTSGYLRDRQFKFNYYAVKALLARVYLYNGDSVKALACAQEVINSAKFPETTKTLSYTTNKISSTEVIFNIYLNNLAVLYDASYSTTIPTGMYMTDAETQTVYEVSKYGGTADNRYQYLTTLIGTNRYTTKFLPTFNTVAPNRLPLMRVSEMYDIAAECQVITNPVAAVENINIVRRRRGLAADLNAANLTAAQIQDEIFKEYRKDFVTEGQLFFYYKRLNMTKIEFTQIPGSNAVYVLPKPDDEIEYGLSK